MFNLGRRGLKRFGIAAFRPMAVIVASIPLIGVPALLSAAPGAEKPPLPREDADPPPQPQLNRGALQRGLRFHDEEESTDRPPLSQDRQTIRQLESANELIEKKNYAEGIRQLQRVLDNPEDTWTEPAPGQGERFLSARRVAADRIGRLPATARDTYETEFGQIARRMLDEALSHGRRDTLEETVRRFFHTRAGYEAAYLLGNRLLDASLPLAAAAQFDRLRNSPGAGTYEPMLSLKTAYCWLRGGVSEKTRPILADLKRRAPADSIKLGGRSVALFDRDTDALPWLARVMGAGQPTASRPASVLVDDWSIVGGSLDRNSDRGPALPLGSPVWQQSVIRDSHFGGKERFDTIERVLGDYTRELNDGGALTIPAASPLIVGRTVVFRNLARLRAVDLHTGEPLWDSLEADRQYKVLSASRPGRTGNRIPVNVEAPEQDDLKLFLNGRSYLDETYGEIASDGERVFAIFDTGFVGQGDDSRLGMQGPLGGAPTHNILSAVDLESGRLLWEVGGARTDRSRELAGTFFLGCGLPVGPSLYCLGERDGEITLYQLDAASGKPTWSQRLALPAGRLPFFPLRRMAGGSPSYAGGLLICPLTAGVIVACDPASRSLAWEYRYPINMADVLPKPRDWVHDPLLLLRDVHDESSRWLDSSPIIAEGRAIITPRDSKELHCIDLADGSLRWKRERDTGLFVAGAFDGAVIVVGRSALEALRLSDGTPLWAEAVPLPAPAGRGFRTGRLYHLPLSTGELATIDLRAGRVLTRSKFADDVQPGNLVAAAGAVVSQSATAVRGYRSLPATRQAIAASLARRPDDAEALAMRGELKLHTAQTASGLEDLDRSLHLRPDRRTQSLAAATVIESLRFDFERNRRAAERIEALISDPDQRFEYHHLMAQRLEQAGDLPGAFEHNLRLVQDERLSNSLVPVSESLRVLVPLAIAPELGRLYGQIAAPQRVPLEQKVDRWVSELTASPAALALKRGIAALRDLPEGRGMRRSLIDKLSARKSFDEEPAVNRAELVRQLGLLRVSGARPQQAFATKRLARLLIDHGRADDALRLINELDQQFGQTVCDGKTGSQWATAWRTEPAVKKAAAGTVPWPRTKLAVKRHEDRSAVHNNLSLPLDQRASPLFRHWRFEVPDPGQRGFTLVAIDSVGTERWRLPLTAGALGSELSGDLPIAVRAHGSLLELVLHRRIAMLDAFDGSAPPRLLWTRPLFDPLRSPENQGRSEIGLTGLVTDEFVFYQVGSVLCCADPVSGQVLWERRNLSSSYSVTGDEDYILAVNRAEASEPTGFVLRSATGAEVSKGAFGISGPLYGEWRGRRVLTSSVQTGFLVPRLSISLVDVALKKTIWTEKYDMPAQSIQIDEEDFAVLDMTGKLHFHSVETGAQRTECQIERMGSPVVRRLGGRYVVIGQNAPGRYSPLRRNRSPLGGKIWMIDRATGKIDFTAAAPPMQYLIDTPEGAPIVVLARTVRVNGGELALTVLDSRTGDKIYEGHETVSDRPGIRLDPEARRITIRTDKSRLEITPTDTPLPAASSKSP